MRKFYYFGTDGQVYGPHTETEVQAWYVSGYFSSEIRFLISEKEELNSEANQYTLGELIEMNGRTLPFYFAPEKENREREDKWEMEKLKQEFQSLLASQSKNDDDKNTITTVQSQLEVLKESHDEIRKRLDSQEQSTVIVSQLERIMSELKERIDEDCNSTKTDLSLVTTKCDHVDTKLDRLIEKQKEADEKMAACGQLVSGLKDSEKSIRDSLKTRERNEDATADLIRLIDNALRNYKMEIMKGKQLSTVHEVDINKNRKDIEEALERIREHSDKLGEVEKNEAALRNEIEMLKEEAIQKAGKVQSAVAAGSDSIDKVVGNLPTKIDEDGIVKKIKAPWESDKTPVAAAVMKADVVVEIEKGNAPLESDETKTENSEKNRAPWDDDKSQPESEPWNRTKNDSDRSKKASGKATSIDQKAKQDQGKVETAAAKPASRAKDWNAICRELSDDEAEEGQDKPIPKMALIKQSVQRAQNFMDGFLEAFTVYCSALDCADFDQIAQFKGDYESMIKWQATADADAQCCDIIREALRKTLQEFTSKTLLCMGCGSVLMTPYMMYSHFTDPAHITRRLGGGDKYTVEYNKMNHLIVSVLYKFVMPQWQQEVWIFEDANTEMIGQERFAKQRNPHAFRPTVDFQKKIVAQLTQFDPDAPIPPAGVLPIEVAREVMARGRAHANQARESLNCKRRRRQLQADFDKHLSKGVLLLLTDDELNCSKRLKLMINVSVIYLSSPLVPSGRWPIRLASRSTARDDDASCRPTLTSTFLRGFPRVGRARSRSRAPTITTCTSAVRTSTRKRIAQCSRNACGHGRATSDGMRRFGEREEGGTLSSSHAHHSDKCS